MEPSEQEEDGSSQGKVLHHFVSQVTPVTILCLWQRWKVLEWRRSNSRTAVSRCVPLFKSAFGKTEQCSQHSGVRHRACTITVVILVHKLSALPAWKPNQISGYCCASIKPAQVSHENTFIKRHHNEPLFIQSTLKFKQHEKVNLQTSSCKQDRANQTQKCFLNHGAATKLWTDSRLLLLCSTCMYTSLKQF